MKHFLHKPAFALFTFLLLACTHAHALTISGTVTDQDKKPVPFANILIKDSYDGGSADANGKYSFTTDATGTITLVCHQLGYEEVQKTVTLTGADITVDFSLKGKTNEMEVVTISAGTIEASDEKRTTVLKPLDIVTTAGGEGDIYGAVATLPGSSRVADQGGLFVRGGTGEETKTIIDGMNVNTPYSVRVPDLASRGRFSPFLFKGTVFSTGGYSAQYGQALSSALVLETQDLPDESSSTLAITSVGLGAGHEHLWDKKGFSAGFDVDYTNLAPYFAVVPQLQNYTRKPQFDGMDANFRKKIGENGMLKFYGYYNYTDLALKTNDIDSTNGYQSLFGIKNSDAYTNLSFRNFYGEKWRLDAATSWAYDRSDIQLNRDTVQTGTALTQGKIMATRYFMTRDKLRFGTEYQYLTNDSKFDSFKNNFFDNYVSAFAESDIFIGSKFVARVGGRIENSSLLAKTNLAPRLSLAMKTGKHSQASVAYGDFYEKPTNDILFLTHAINFEKATHYILSFQHVDDSLTLRVEAYYKQYSNLVRTVPAIANNGNGYAKGFDLFFRDKRTLKNVDYWISYTYLDTKRIYRDFPVSAMPTFASTHNASLVFKLWIPKILTSVGFSYNYASGRPYYNPNNPTYLGDKTRDYNSLNINASYLTHFLGAFTVLVVSVTNVTGFNNVYGYRYSYDGMRSQAIIPPAKRSFFIGCFMSFGTDRSKDVINNNN